MLQGTRQRLENFFAWFHKYSQSFGNQSWGEWKDVLHCSLLSVAIHSFTFGWDENEIRRAISFLFSLLCKETLNKKSFNWKIDRDFRSFLRIFFWHFAPDESQSSWLFLLFD